MDTAGMETFRSVNTNYYRNAHCCLLVYDITARKSFEDCENYFNVKLKECCKKDIPIILLGNKTDLENERKISPEEGANFALKNNYIFMETSCLKNTNVADAFETLIEITNREEIKKKEEKIFEEGENNNNNNIKINFANQLERKHKKEKCYF